MNCEQEIIDLKTKIASNTERIFAIEQERGELTKSVQKMAVAVEVLAVEQKHAVEQQKLANEKLANMQNEVEKIKLAPAEDAKHLKNEILKSVILTVIGALLGAVLALILK